MSATKLPVPLGHTNPPTVEVRHRGTRVTHIHAYNNNNKGMDNDDLPACRLVSMDLVMCQAMLREPYPPNASADCIPDAFLNKKQKTRHEAHRGATTGWRVLLPDPYRSTVRGGTRALRYLTKRDRPPFCTGERNIQEKGRGRREGNKEKKKRPL